MEEFIDDNPFIQTAMVDGIGEWAERNEQWAAGLRTAYRDAIELAQEERDETE
jgi:hypothetical protein